MGPWTESLGVACLAVLGAGAGWLISRLRGPLWTIGCLLPIAMVLMIAGARRLPQLEFTPPFSWLMVGRMEYALLGPIAAMLLTTPLSRLKHLRQRVVLVMFMIGFVVYSAIMPFLMPAFIRQNLASIRTWVDTNGVCWQQTKYTCGPAAAVTALRRLGLAAHEGDLAILMHTSPLAGTAPDVMANLLQERYAADGLACQYRHFDSIAQLPRDTPVVAIIKLSFMVDHFVAILQVTDTEVVVGDPLEGKRAYSHDGFREKWRFAGIVLTRKAR